MTKKVLVIPDVHGRLFWKEPVAKYMDEVDRVVFLGDYLDPYSGETGLADDIYENLMEIIELKRNNREKVVLLKGNHDQHYASKIFDQLAGGSRQDLGNWNTYHRVFYENRDLFKIAHWEEVNGKTYVFTHAGLTLYWLKKVNDRVWKLPDHQVSIADPDIIERINQLDDDGVGQEMLGTVGRRRSWFGEKTGSVLWADIQEHDIDEAPKAYGLNKVFQVFGHTRLNEGYDKIEFDHLAMIDSRQAFVVEGREPTPALPKGWGEPPLTPP
jgi:predicted phosphodiesterase